MLIIMRDRLGLRPKAGDIEADETSSLMFLSPILSKLGSHVEGLGLAAAAKLLPLLICLRATRRQHRDREKGERVGRGCLWGERGRIRKMDLDAGEV